MDIPNGYTPGPLHVERGRTRQIIKNKSGHIIARIESGCGFADADIFALAPLMAGYIHYIENCHRISEIITFSEWQAIKEENDVPIR